MQVTFATTQSSCFTWISKPNKDADSGMMEPILEGNLSAANAMFFFSPLTLLVSMRVQNQILILLFLRKASVLYWPSGAWSPLQREWSNAHSPPQGTNWWNTKTPPCCCYMISILISHFHNCQFIHVDHLWRSVACVITHHAHDYTKFLWRSASPNLSGRSIFMSHC